MTRALEELENLARNPDVPILIEGETGTGKTMVARHIHSISPRGAGPFQEVSLAALEDALANSDLFGHVVGGFTGAVRDRAGYFASAQHGTIFLDEISKASRGVQQKLLAAVEQREIRPVGSDRVVRVDTRIIAASNMPLADAVRDAGFLQDLYARLKMFRVSLPPLRERRADIPLLVERFVAAHATGRHPPTISDALMHALCTAEWPGNLRELSGTLQRLLLDAGNATTITFDHCCDALHWLADLGGLGGPLTPERVAQVLAESENNVTHAAHKLGVSRATLHRFLKRRSRDLGQGARGCRATPETRS